MIGYLRFLFSPFGRVSRKDIWFKYLLPVIVSLSFASLFDTDLFANSVLLFFAWPSIAVSAKRFHDRNMSGWWALSIIVTLFFVMSSLVWALTTTVRFDAELFTTILFIVAFAPMVFTFVANYCLAGHSGPNKYGPDPLDVFGDPADAFD